MRRGIYIFSRVCLCVCLCCSVRDLTFASLDLQTLFVVVTHLQNIYRSSSSIKMTLRDLERPSLPANLHNTAAFGANCVTFTKAIDPYG